MFEGLRWHKAQHDAEAVIQHAVQTLAQVGKAPLVIGSFAAIALLGMVTGMGLNHRGYGRSRAKVLAARVRNGGDGVMSGPRNGRPRRTRKRKAAH